MDGMNLAEISRSDHRGMWTILIWQRSSQDRLQVNIKSPILATALLSLINNGQLDSKWTRAIRHQTAKTRLSCPQHHRWLVRLRNRGRGSAFLEMAGVAMI